MKIQNTLDLDLDEAVFLLNDLATSLKNEKRFQFELKGQSASVDVGTGLIANLNFSPDQFSIVFNWRNSEEISQPSITPKPVEEDWRTAFDQDLADAGIPLRSQPNLDRSIDEQAEIPISDLESTSADSSIMEQTSESGTPEILATEESKISEPLMTQLGDISEVQIVQRMALKTTTLPFEGGFWSPAFSFQESVNWSQIKVDLDLENTKWVSEEDLAAMEAITPESIQAEEDDLFSELDPLSKSRIGAKDLKKPTRFVRPAGMISQSIGSSSDISREELNEAIANWKEPTPEENVSSDTWVKPSEILKQKEKTAKSKKTSNSSKIPKVGGSSRVPSPSKNSSDSGEKLVKPSEIHKRNEQLAEEEKRELIESAIKKKEKMDKRNRPPPTAPDKKTPRDRKKGWAKW